MNYKNYFKQRLFEQLALSEAEFQGMEDGIPVFTPSNPSTKPTPAPTPKPKPPTQPINPKPPVLSPADYEAQDRRQRRRSPSDYQD